jgi:hypothetical protein
MIGRIVIAAISVVLLGGCGGWPLVEPSSDQAQKPIGLVRLSEFHEDIGGLMNWAHELDQRGLKSLVCFQKNMLELHSVEIQWFAAQGHEVGGTYAEEPFWDVPYETQLEIMQETKELVEEVTGSPMRVFGSRYFAYDENTLRAADELGVEYILARGTADVEALIYEPDEYDCKIISVSNVAFEDMGRGSLCDYSLWARGSTAAEFEQVLDDALAKRPKRVMIVSHAYLGGAKQEWWDAYAQLLDGGEVEWVADFDAWVAPESGVNLHVPMSLIPENREVLYTTPTPAVPLEEIEDVDQMYNPCAPL